MTDDNLMSLDELKRHRRQAAKAIKLDGEIWLPYFKLFDDHIKEIEQQNELLDRAFNFAEEH